MTHIRKLLDFVIPYWKLALLALIFLTIQVFLDLAIPRLIQRIIDDGITRQDMHIVLQTTAIMLAISLLSVVVSVGNNIYSVRVGENAARDIREAIFLKIQSFSPANMDRFTTGNLMVRLTNDTSAAQRLFQVSLRIGTRAPLMMVGSVILMVKTSSSLVLHILPVFLITMAVIIFFSFKLEPFFGIVQKKLDRLNTVLQENIAGVRLVKAFARADYESSRFEEANDDFTRQNIRVMRVMASMTPLLTIVVDVAIVLVVWDGGLQAIAGELTVGEIVAFTNYLMMTMTPLLMMTMLINIWANGIASARRINEVLDVMPDIAAEAGLNVLPLHIKGDVSMENVSFQYHGNSAGAALKDISFRVQSGQTIAILGATGAGKSTLIKLIARYYDVSLGQICIDGLDVRKLQPDSLLAHIAMVPQETILFSGTIHENICYGRPDATRQDVETAARTAQAHDFIVQFSEGYDHHVEARGANLSGGQKQRIAIARAIIMQPEILILDDSTSAVDVETETKIQRALDELMRNTTRFIVAQRISTVLNADHILVIDRGCIAAAGSHSQLMESSPIYREIFDSQLGDAYRPQSDLFQA